MEDIVMSINEYSNEIKHNVRQIELDEIYINTELYLRDTSMLTPLAYSSYYSSCLYINKEYYESNKEQINSLVIDTIKTTSQTEFYLNEKALFNNDVVDAVLSNENIKWLSLKGDIILDRTTIDKLLKSNVHKLRCNVDFENDEELLYDYIPGLDIVNYPLIARTSLMDFGMEYVDLVIDRELTNYELKHLSTLFKLYPQEKITVDFKDKSQIEQIMNIINSKKIIIKNYDKFNNNQLLFFKNNYPSAVFEVTLSATTSSENLIDRNEILDMIIKEVRENNLTPLEKYMYLYNIVKMFKEYKEIPPGRDIFESRHSEFTLFNDYMVCVGYASLLEELVARLNDNDLLCLTYGCAISKNDESVGHRRCIVKIKDHKYGIDGVFISDPTWDSISYFKTKKLLNGKKKTDYKKPNADIDLYNHFLMSKDEVLDEDVKYYQSDATDILFGRNQTFKDSYTRYSTEEEATEIKEKFKLKNCDSIISNSIDAVTIISAIRNIYSKIYDVSDEQIERLLDTTIENNIINRYKHFNNTSNKFGITKVKVKKK